MKHSKKDSNKVLIQIPALGFEKIVTKKFWRYFLKMGGLKKCGLILEK
jgi:hypothetical protein